MDYTTLRGLYRDRGVPDDETTRAIAACEEYESFLAPRKRAIETATVADIREYLETLEQNGTCDRERMLAIARANYLVGNNDVYVHFTQVLERANIIGNLRTHMENVLGPQRAARIFAAAGEPPAGAPPEAALPFTRALLESLRAETTGVGGDDITWETEIREEALRGNAHGIPAEAFAAEREHFLSAGSVKEYLDGFHARSVATLEEHARTGQVWFEQTITDEVVDFVRSNNEVLGGDLKGDRIYWTKIPFRPKEWLTESDPRKRRYLACHCPMAREALANPAGKVPRLWCNCTAGYIRQRFNAVFAEDTKVEVLESVLDGDDRCRFVVHLPPGVREQQRHDSR